MHQLPHDPTRCIVFREWVECLVRVAFAWYYQAAFSGAVNRKRMASVMRQASGASLSGELSVTSVTRADTFSAEEEDVEVSLSMFFEHLVEDCLIPLHVSLQFQRIRVCSTPLTALATLLNLRCSLWPVRQAGAGRQVL